MQHSFDPISLSNGVQVITPYWAVSLETGLLYSRSVGHQHFTGLTVLPFLNTADGWAVTHNVTSDGEVLRFITRVETAKRESGLDYSFVEYQARTGKSVHCVVTPKLSYGDDYVEPALVSAALRTVEGDDCIHIECTMQDGQKGALIRVDAAFPELAAKVVELLSADAAKTFFLDGYGGYYTLSRTSKK